jgi:pilus assembly protein Flp/PilA
VDSISGKEVESMRYMESFVKGQGLVEYALIMLFVALIIIVVLAILGPSVGNMYSQVVPNI